MAGLVLILDLTTLFEVILILKIIYTPYYIIPVILMQNHGFNLYFLFLPISKLIICLIQIISSDKLFYKPITVWF